MEGAKTQTYNKGGWWFLGGSCENIMPSKPWQREMNVDEEAKLRPALGLYRSTRNGEVDVGCRKFQTTSWKKWNLTLPFKSE